MTNTIYIAAPFFNPVQLAIVQTIEDTLNNNNLRYFSPRMHSGSADFKGRTDVTYAEWNTVMQRNVHAISYCTAMIAVLDYALPQDTCLELSTYVNTGNRQIIDVSIPDTGTVWEMGKAYGHIPIIGYYHKEMPDRMNLMLAQCVDYFIVRPDNLNQWARYDGHARVIADADFIVRPENYTGKVI